MTPRLTTRLAAFWLAWVLGSTAWAQAAFSFDSLAQTAATRALTPFADTAKPLPPELAALDYDGIRDIRFRSDRALWRNEGTPFEAMFFHLGNYQTQPVRVHEITPSGVRDLPFDRADFDYGRNRFSTQAGPETWGDLGHAGFRVHYPLNTAAYRDELIVFLGASYFRALGAGQQYGLSARGLAIDTVGGTGGGSEEFPRFTDFWLERPAPGASTLTVYALLDSPRATGAYRFDIRPGTSSTTTVRARIYLRGATAGATPGNTAARPIATLGIAPLTSMFFFGENQPRSGDFRPEVHDSDGLMIAGGDGEWLWRPLQNPRQPIVNSFSMPSLRGFGLMQRDRVFASYEDTEARYERRPSAWVRPIGDWGPGRVELLQLPTPDETHDNIVAYWVPASLPAPGTPLEVAYDIVWQGADLQRPPAAWTTQTRRGTGYSRHSAAEAAGVVQYVVDFSGPALDALPPGAAVQAVASSDANGRIEQQLIYRNPATDGWRLTLRVRRLDATRPVELRAFLQHQTHTVSETWSNILLPD